LITQKMGISRETKQATSMKTLWLFKLFNTIKDEHEITFAELELRSLHGPVERVRNFLDVITDAPLHAFCDDGIRLQDTLSYEPAYGKYQGFMSWTDHPSNVSKLVRRLTYTREFYIATPGNNAEDVLRKVFPEGRVGYNVSTHARGDFVLLRIVPNQFFLEKSYYLSKLSRHEQDIDKNVESLFKYPFEALYRVPASATMAVGKRLEDYFTIREEISLYLTHVWHPYKAKFHAKMARALLNYIAPNDDALVMDNWAGSGTLNVEATLMGIRNIGLEINPLSALMADVKSQAFAEDPAVIRSESSKFLDQLSQRLPDFRSRTSTTTLLHFGKGSVQTTDVGTEITEVREEVATTRSLMKNLFSDEQIHDFVIARRLIEGSYEGFMRRLLLLALSGSISDLARRRKGQLLDVLTLRLFKLMYLRLYLFARLNEILGIIPGKSVTYICDNRDPFNTARSLEGKNEKLVPGKIDAIVTSPPYSTAVDYIRNDLPQLTLLKMVKTPEDLEELERSLEGNPKPRLYRDNKLIHEVETKSGFYMFLPQAAKASIEKLREAGREPEALRSYKFFKDIYASLIAMNRLLKSGGKCVIVIGNNHYKISEDEVEEVKNDRIIFELALRPEVGFAPDPYSNGMIARPLEKTQAGYIRNETVLILEKVTDGPKPEPPKGL
jgi:DNA modification methylase